MRRPREGLSNFTRVERRRKGQARQEDNIGGMEGIAPTPTAFFGVILSASDYSQPVFFF